MKESTQEKLAIIMTRAFGSMTCFWIFVVWALIPLVPKLSHFQTTILYISAGFIQLVALPLISVGQNIQGKKVERLIEDTHRKVIEEIKLLKEKG